MVSYRHRMGAFMRRSFAIAVCLAVFLSITSTRIMAAPTTVEAGWGALAFNAGAAPRNLPGKSMGGVQLSVSAELRASNLAEGIPGLREMVVEFDRNGQVDPVGLATCSRKLLEGLNIARARTNCHAATIGTGTAQLGDASGGATTPAPLTVFNGGLRNGAAVAFIHTAVKSPAGQIPAVAEVVIRAIKRGRFGLEARAKVPAIPGDQLLRSFQFTVGRSFVVKGKRKNYVSARCVDGHLEGQLVTASFDNGENIRGEHFVRACSVAR
jgi:hypothetical protein